MNVFLIGGTGLIGSEVAKILISRGHKVKSIALPDVPLGAKIPDEMELIFGNYIEMKDNKLLEYMQGCDSFIFAAGIDERVEGSPPIYELYKKYNIIPLKRLLKLAKIAGIKHSVILGSYFNHFSKKWPKQKYSIYHPYIRSREAQELMAFSFADKNFNVAVVELPYIFGTQPGRKPVWTLLVEMLSKMKRVTFYPKGGSTMITLSQAATAVVGALETNIGANSYPIGFYNLKWKDFLKIVHKGMGYKESRKIITIPNFIFKIFSIKIEKQKKKENIEMGLNMKYFTNLQTKELFIDKSIAVSLGVVEDGLEKAIIESIKQSVDAYFDKEKKFVEMKGE